jgi:hypothetical protein
MGSKPRSAAFEALFSQQLAAADKAIEVFSQQLAAADTTVKPTTSSGASPRKGMSQPRSAAFAALFSQQLAPSDAKQTAPSDTVDGGLTFAEVVCDDDDECAEHAEHADHADHADGQRDASVVEPAEHLATQGVSQPLQIADMPCHVMRPVASLHLRMGLVTRAAVPPLPMAYLRPVTRAAVRV